MQLYVVSWSRGCALPRGQQVAKKCSVYMAAVVFHHLQRARQQRGSSQLAVVAVPVGRFIPPDFPLGRWLLPRRHLGSPPGVPRHLIRCQVVRCLHVPTCLLLTSVGRRHPGAAPCHRGLGRTCLGVGGFWRRRDRDEQRGACGSSARARSRSRAVADGDRGAELRTPYLRNMWRDLLRDLQALRKPLHASCSVLHRDDMAGMREDGSTPPHSVYKTAGMIITHVRLTYRLLPLRVRCLDRTLPTGSSVR